MAALDGLRVLDMTQYEAGTSCTQALAWLGADVVKVERPDGGDPGRGAGGDAEYFVVWNSNKRSVAIDLRSADGRALFMRMVPNYDVFVENYGPGVIERLDIGYEAMRAVKSDIIYARIKGFGVDGPWSDYKCYDMVAQAAAGAFSITGENDGPPMRPGPTMGDAGTGIQMALAIAAAYAQKLRTGKGQLIELSMQEAMTYYLRTATSSGNYGEHAANRSGNGLLPTMSLYPCAGGGPNDYVYVMAVTPKMWVALCRVIDREDLVQHPQFSRQADRYHNRDELRGIIGTWALMRDKYQAMRELAEGGVPASAVLDTSDLYNNPHLVERGFVHEVEHPRHGAVKLLGWPVRMSESSVEIEAAPLLGQHSKEVLNDDLGLTQTELDDLTTQGVIKQMESNSAGR
tara:strand:+ start:330 stop:1535 length:1206 start_codon:yes stop_codon:yes gene_type:complete